jgi:iron complex transport system substrate-binding protein
MGGFAVACGLFLLHCGPAEFGPEEPDADARPMRIVSLTPEASRFLLALGAGAAVVAVDPASGRIPGLEAAPRSGLAEAPRFAPDLILVPELVGADLARVAELNAGGREIVSFAPHDLDDAFASCRELGARIVGRAEASALEHRLSRDLARIGGASFGRPRPRVAALVQLVPLELAGGHSFVTDLIEIAGGHSVTHDREDHRLRTDAEGLASLAPDLVLVVGAEGQGSAAHEAARAISPPATPVELFVFEPSLLWTGGMADAALRLRALIEPLSDALAASQPLPDR